ncbi:Aldo/keto reductase [Crepidotus variabilis]|uniref:Aldo/keto reductase n=1 Tax=Crepidotus variabilis TaxID=179855 RepID=A0A9P6E567_9AGAR|nr:Aldo/keto reductase [Crepidotus variabilis]
MASSKLTLKSTVTLSSGYTLPLLGFGVYQNDNAKPSVLEALKAGYRHIDSAQMYKNEEAVGQAVRESGLKRSEIFITTKCFYVDHGYHETLRGVETSLARLNVDYIDLFLIHDPLSGKIKRLETYKALLEAKTAGKIRTVGVSNFNVQHLEEIKAAGFEAPAVNQIELHPLCQQKEIVKYCRASNIVVEAYCPIIRGKTDNPAIVSLATKYNRDPPQILIRWSLQRGFVPLPKSATAARIRSNASIYDFDLTEKDLKQLDDLDQGKAGAISWNPVEMDSELEY